MTGYSEAALYSHELNSKFPPNVNPCKFILATNGVSLHAGYWDCDPVISCRIEELGVGTPELDGLIEFLGSQRLNEHATKLSDKLSENNFSRPFNQGEGAALLGSHMQQNDFASDISPVLRKYFTSRSQNDDPEIYDKAYVSTNEVTSYDGNLDSLLKDRVARQKSRVAIQTERSKAEVVTKRLGDHVTHKSNEGDIQIITGGVGSGKSLFARRYKEVLQPESLKDTTHWSFINFNEAPDDLSDRLDWVQAEFVKSLMAEGIPVNLRNAEDQSKIFAANILDRQAYYEKLNAITEGKGDLEAARDIEQWRTDPETLSLALSRTLQGERGGSLIVVFDNVDRRDTDQQLAAFRLAQRFQATHRCLILLQMRDVTFELHKNEPPLDTHRAGKVFHLSPPRFVDVVKKRLALSIEALSKEGPETISFNLPAGGRVEYPRTSAGVFLTTIYVAIFDNPGNSARIIEAIAGRNVRKALDMFMAIITSGHMPETLIARVSMGKLVKKFPEYRLIRILMRQDKKFFSNSSGFISNIFDCTNSWQRPSNFLLIEILFFLNGRRKRQGDNGQMGYYSLPTIQESLILKGFITEDIKAGLDYLIQRELIEADSAEMKELKLDSCVKSTASGWAHLRILSARSEYITGILPTTPISDETLRAKVFSAMRTENSTGGLSLQRNIDLAIAFHEYLVNQFESIKAFPGYTEDGKSGAQFVIQNLQTAIDKMRNPSLNIGELDWIDGV